MNLHPDTTKYLTTVLDFQFFDRDLALQLRSYKSTNCSSGDFAHFESILKNLSNVGHFNRS